MVKKGELTHKQKVFAKEYAIDKNGSRAARAAGYSPHTAGEMACENLKKPHVFAAIKKYREKYKKKYKVNRSNVLREYARIAFADKRQLYDEDGKLKSIKDLDDDIVAAIAGLDHTTIGSDDIGMVTKVRMADKNRALDSLSKNLGLFEEHNKQKGTDLDEVVKWLHAGRTKNAEE